MSTGQGFGYSLFGNSIKSNDVTAINNYANALKNGASVGEAWCTTMNGTSVAAKQYVLNARKAGKSTAELTQGLNNMTLGAKASTVAMKALGVAKNVALNLGVVAIITLLTKAFSAFVHAQENAVEKAREAAQATSEQAEKSSDAANELLKLKKQLDDDTVSAEDLTKAFREQAKNIPGLSDDVKNLAGEYRDLAGAIDQATTSALENARNDAVANVNATGKALVKSANSVLSGDSTISLAPGYFDDDAFGKEAERLEKIISKNAKIGSQGLETTIKVYEPKGDNAEDVYAYYQSLVELQDEIKSLADGDVNSKLFDTTLYKQTSEAIKTVEEDIKSYTSAIQRLHEADAQLDLSNYLKTNDIATKEDFDSYIQGVNDGTIGMVDGKEASEEYKQVLISVANDAFPQFSSAAKTAGKNADEMTVSLSELEGASDKIKTLGSAFKELSDDGYITTKTLGEIQTATGLSGDEWAEYESKLLNAKKGSAEFSQIMADLTYKMLDQTFANKDLNSLTEQQISAILRENGVVNADAVAHDWLTKAKETLRIKTALAKASTAEEVVALATEASQAGITGNALNDLIMDMGIFNNTNLDVSQKVAALQEMGYYAHWTAQGLANIDKVKKYSFDGKDYIASYDKDGKLVDIEQEKQVEIPNVEIPKITIPNYSGATSGGKSGSEKDKPDYEDPTDAIIDRINLRHRELEQQEEYIENAREIAELENDYKKQISLTNDLIAKRKDRLTELETANAGLHNEAEWLRNSTPQWNEEEWFDSQGNATKAYIDFINDRIKSGADKEEVDAIKDQFEAISKYKKAYMDNSEEIAGINKEILQDEEKIWDLRREEFDARMEESEYYIQHSKDFGWENGDNEIAARKRVLDWIQSDYYKSLIKDDVEYYKLLEEHRLNYIEAQKEEFNKANDFASSYIDSQKTLLQSYFDVTNSIVEAQHEINKELETSKTMYEWLDENTRKLLFNQEDYNILSEELYDIQYKADKLRRQYERDLENSTLNTIEEITSNYEMQYDMLMKSYEIAKADLEVAKKKQKLNNVLNERNVRMFINGQWQWVANTQDVIDAQSELADAEYARKTAEAGERQTKSLNNLTKQQDELGSVINKFEDGVITLDNAMDDVVGIFGKLPDYVEKAFTKIQGVSSKSSSSKTSYSKNINSDYVSWAKSQMATNSAKWHTASDTEKKALESANQSLGSAIGSTYDSATGTWKHKYGSGTKNTLPGKALLGENGDEMFIDNKGHLIPINQPTIADIGAGGTVFNQFQMKNLKDWWDLSNIAKPYYNFVGERKTQQVVSHDNRIIINGMTVDSGSRDGQALINAFHRYLGNH